MLTINAAPESARASLEKPRKGMACYAYAYALEWAGLDSCVDNLAGGDGCHASNWSVHASG